MSGCPSVHEHPEFKRSSDPNNKTQQAEIGKLKRFLKSDPGHFVGEQLKHELSPFKSFPRGHKDVRNLFILCKDCKKEVIKPTCDFCGSLEHSMNDAVLFYSADHDKSYKKGKEIIQKYTEK